MTRPRHVEEPADTKPVIIRAEEPAPTPERTYDPMKRIKVYDPTTGRIHPGTVPETWLQEFPHLKQTPTSVKKAGKQHG